MATPLATFASGWQQRYALPDWRQRLTRLSPEQEQQFQQWAQQTRAPITDDYDMRGYWLNDRQQGTHVNRNDGLPHYTDRWKTPLHQSFSGESVYANPNSNPPHWNEQDQLVTPDGTVLYDERRGSGRAVSASALDAITARGESGSRDYYSSGAPVTSTAGARFAMQVMPATARDPGFGLRPADPNSPEDMNRLGREYRATMQQRYGGDLRKMWAAYNAGPGAVDRAIKRYGENWLQHMRAETRGYVERNMRELRGR